MILLHGLFSDANMNWIKFGHAERIAAAGFRVIMPDLRAHGLSASPQGAEHYPRGYPGPRPSGARRASWPYRLRSWRLFAWRADDGRGGRRGAEAAPRDPRRCRARGPQELEAAPDFLPRGDRHVRRQVPRADPHWLSIQFMKSQKVDRIAAKHLLDTFEDTAWTGFRPSPCRRWSCAAARTMTMARPRSWPRRMPDAIYARSARDAHELGHQARVRRSDRRLPKRLTPTGGEFQAQTTRISMPRERVFMKSLFVASVSLAALALLPAQPRRRQSPTAAGSGRPAEAATMRRRPRRKRAPLSPRPKRTCHDHALIQSRADWVNATYVNDDTDALAAYFGAIGTEKGVKYATEAAKYADVPGLDPDTARKLNILRGALVAGGADRRRRGGRAQRHRDPPAVDLRQGPRHASTARRSPATMPKR